MDIICAAEVLLQVPAPALLAGRGVHARRGRSRCRRRTRGRRPRSACPAARPSGRPRPRRSGGPQDLAVLGVERQQVLRAVLVAERVDAAAGDGDARVPATEARWPSSASGGTARLPCLQQRGVGRQRVALGAAPAGPVRGPARAGSLGAAGAVTTIVRTTAVQARFMGDLRLWSPPTERTPYRPARATPRAEKMSREAAQRARLEGPLGRGQRVGGVLLATGGSTRGRPGCRSPGDHPRWPATPRGARPPRTRPCASRPARSSTYRLPSSLPANTRPPATTGDESMRACVANVQTATPVFASRQCTSLSRPPTTTRSVRDGRGSVERELAHGMLVAPDDPLAGQVHGQDLVVERAVVRAAVRDRRRRARVRAGHDLQHRRCRR